MKRNFFVVANPASGTKKLEDILREVLDFFSAKRYKYEVFLTAKSLNAWKTVENHLDDTFTDLVIIGGDGTINEAVNGLRYDIPISIIPNGTGNDFAKNLYLGESLEDHIQVIDHGEIKRVDVGICNNRKFLNGVGIGFDGQIVANMQNNRSILRGPLKYYYYVLSILATYRARIFQYSIDSEELNKPLILLCIANGTTFGGSFRLTPKASLTDGKLDICEIGKISALKRFLNIYRLQRGTHTALSAVKLKTGSKITIAAQDKLYAHIDGELLGRPPFDISIKPGALSVKVLKAKN